MDACIRPSPANPDIGLSLWLNRPGGQGGQWYRAPEGAPGGWIYPDGEPELFAALGAGGNRMYILPSREMVVVRQGEVEEVRPADSYQDAFFLSLLLTGEEPELLPQVRTAGWTRGGR